MKYFPCELMICKPESLYFCYVMSKSGDLVCPKSNHLTKCSSNSTSPIFCFFSWQNFLVCFVFFLLFLGLRRVIGVSFRMEMQSTSNVV